jgi:hypothetical protein
MIIFITLLLLLLSYYYDYYSTIIIIIIIIISIIIIHILTIMSNNCQTIFSLFRIDKNITLSKKNIILSLFQNYHSSKAIP